MPKHKVPRRARLALLPELLLSIALSGGAVASAAPALPSLAEPSLSPDGREIAFVSGGDIWTAPVAGGEARLLVSHPATESRPLYSPDGSRLAFVSTRTGNGDLYVLTLATGAMQQITFDDAPEQLDAWSRDGKYLYFSTASRDIAGMQDVYRVPVTGGTPMPVSDDRYASEYWSSPAPNGRDVAFTARGIVSAQWWRKGHSHLDESDIYIRHDGQPAVYERVSTGGAKEEWPMWAPDGKTLYFVSDRTGAQNIWAKPGTGAAHAVTKFTNGRVLWPSMAYDGRELVFERDFGIWLLQPSTGEVHQVKIQLRGSPAGPGVTHQSLTQGFTDLALSPDGKKVAVLVHGEVFAASAKDGGNAQRITQTPAEESQVSWSPDSRRLLYVSSRSGRSHIVQYDFASGAEQELTTGDHSDVTPQYSPDGHSIAYLRDGRELHVADLNGTAAAQDHVVAKAYLDRPPVNSLHSYTWSPDNKYLAYVAPATRGFRNVLVVSRDGGDAKPISFLANGFSGDVAWSKDGTYLLFNTGQRTEEQKVARVDLILRTPKFREDQFRDLFRDEPPKAAVPPTTSVSTDAPVAKGPQPVRIVYEDIRQRLRLLPIGVDVHDQVISPDGKTLLLTATAAGQVNLYTYSLDELAKEAPVARQLTSTPGQKSHAQWSSDGKEVYYLEQGKISSIPIDTRVAKPLAVTAEMDVDFQQEKGEVFRQAWSYLNTNFYDPKFHGVDWNAMRDEYAPYAAGAQTPDELRRVINLMIGELNASHSGIGPAPNPGSASTGRLGLRFDPAAYAANGQLKITDVLALGPAAVAGGIKVGDVLTAVDGRSLAPPANLDECLQYKIDRRVSLTIADASGEAHTVMLRPVNATTEKGLLYREWVEKNRAYVAKKSGGTLGYVHLYDMSDTALSQLYLDLDAENHARKGVVVDVRNNNGGFVNAYALDVLTRRPYLNMTFRDSTDANSARSVLGQRSLELPTVLVTNQHSLSDAEDFTEGYRAMHLGKVVGEPTAGWIIYTGNVPLLDGSSLRLPRIRVTDAQGQDMERHPRPVDVQVLRPIGESYSGQDIQLDRAIQELSGGGAAH